MVTAIILSYESVLWEMVKCTATLPVSTDGVERNTETKLKTFKVEIHVNSVGFI